MRLMYMKPKLHDLSQGSRIAFVRQFRHMSQDEVSDKLGITGECKRRTMTRYENTLPDDESYKTGLMKYYKNENERLEKENNKLREENMDLTINKMSNPDISLDDLDSWGISL